MRWPRISIVTPSYNQGQFIGRTVRSVLLQRYPNLDYILMDGGSTDDTVANLARYKDQFSFFVSEPDDGQADALAKGFARSSGEIMAYLNSDDLLAPDTLYFVARYFQSHPDVDCIYSHRCTVDENDRVQWYWILPPHHNFWMKRWDFIPQETCFWRRSLFEKAGNIDPSYHFAMDYDLFVRFMDLGRLHRVNRFLGAFRQHGESKTTQYLAIMGRREMLKVRRKFGIRRLPHDGFFGNLLSLWVHREGGRYANGGRPLPGTFSGLGYDYNDLWGGVLRESDFPCEQDERNRTNESKKTHYDPACPLTYRFPDRLLYSITSSRAGQVWKSEIYLQLTYGTAIILPSLQDYWRLLKNKPQDDEVTGAPSGKGTEQGNFHHALTGKSVLIEEFGRLPSDVSKIKVATGDQTAEQVLELARGLVSENEELAFLDIGCENGKLLDVLKAKTRWKLFGIEAEPTAAAEAISKGHLVFQATLEEAVDLPQIGACFDLIYLGRGIERFNDPRSSLRSVAILLNPGGYLILSTPNLDSEQLELFGPAWAHWKPEEHRYIFSKKSLRRLLAITGFALAKLSTVSCPDAAALSLKRFSESGVAGSGSGQPPNPKLMRQTEVIAKSDHLVTNRHGKGDVIFAVGRRHF